MNIEAGADFSDDGRHRERLWRIWDWEAGLDVWVMLNPSTAGATTESDDLTIKKCCGFSRRWGAGGIMVVNLFTIISTDPAVLRQCRLDALGHWGWIEDEARVGRRVIAAWGEGGLLHARGEVVSECLRQNGITLHCLGHTKNGHPRHPSRLGYDTPLVPFRGYGR